MGIGIVKNESTLALVPEATEGTYDAVSAGNGSEYIEVLADGAELNLTRELLERDLLTDTVEKEAVRTSIANVEGSIPVELKTSSTEGDAPQSLDVLLRSLLGGKRQITSDQTSDDTTHTSTVIYFSDTSAFAVGDCVLIKEDNAYEVRPIASIQEDTSITLAFALDNGAPSNSVVVSQVTTYYHDTANSISFSAEHNLGSQAIQQQVNGLRCNSGSIENWSVGQIPTMTFGVQGLGLARVDADASETPAFSDALPPVALSACMWVDGNKLSYTEFGMSVENTVSYIQDACDADGRIASRITDQTVSVNVNPYMDDSDLSKTWDKFNDNDDVSFFIYAYNPSSTSGEFANAVAIWIPQAKITASPVADNDGIIAENLEIRAHRSSGNDSVFMSFI